MKIKKILCLALVGTMIFSTPVLAAGSTDSQASKSAVDANVKTKFDTSRKNSDFSTLKSEITTEDVECTFTDAGDDSVTSQLADTRRAANKYIWSSSTMAYNFLNQKWSTNTEVFSTYPKNANGFVMSGYLLNPKGQKDYNIALREGYLNDAEYAQNQGHYYKNSVSDEDFNDVTFMLESNTNVFIFDNNLDLIYRSSDEAGVTSYFTRYYSTSKSITGTTNKVISLGLVKGNYYLVFDKKDATKTAGNHYGYYAGQPLPIAQSSTFSDLMHNTTIKWDQYSHSQSATTQTLTVNCPTGMATEYALTDVTFADKSKPFANNTYASSIDYYYTPATAGYSKELTKTGGWWSDLVDTNPPSGSIEGSYATKVTVNWVNGIAYVNAGCTTMTQMTLGYLVPFGIIVG